MVDFKIGSGLNFPEKCKQIESSGCCSDGNNDVQKDIDDYDVNLRQLFDKVLMIFLNGVHDNNIIRPIPALLGDGSSPDLFKLFCLVRERGGHDFVSKDNMWGLIAEKMGLDSDSAASLKLIYSKYLDELDQSLSNINRERILSNGTYESNGNLGLLSLELVKRLREFSLDWSDSVNKDMKASPQKYEKVCDHVHMPPKERFQSPGVEKGDNSHFNAAKASSDDDENINMGEERLGNQSLNLVNNDTHSRKRKRDIFAGMLNWLTQVAKNPWDSSIGKTPIRGNWKENGGKELWYYVLKAREAVLRKSYPNLGDELSLSQRKVRMHPSMYEEQRAIVGIRSSKRLPLLKSASCLCCKSRSSNSARLVCHSKCSLEITLEKPVARQEPQPTKTDSLAAKPTTSSSVDKLPVEKRVCVGPRFQAKVPVWLGDSYESDSKWLGRQIWPPDNRAQSLNIGAEVIGKGRMESCCCSFPGSVPCIRFHTAENRMSLVKELGPAFQHWGFHLMGELVSLSWSAEDESKFKEVMRSSPPSLGKSYFPNKTWKELVSYYFDVYLIYRRAYQNRVTPNDVDSDDDELPFGAVGEAYGLEAVRASRSNSMTCVKNEQCYELDSP